MEQLEKMVKELLAGSNKVLNKMFPIEEYPLKVPSIVVYILYNNLYFGHSTKHLYNKKAIIDEYCSVYDEFQKNKFIQRIPSELLVDKNILFKDIKLSETEYKLFEKFLLKQLKFENIVKIEHFPKR